MAEYVHFTIGESFGQMLFDLAYEKIVCEHDLQKAISVITDSLVGCPRDLAIDIISGKRVLSVDVETQEVCVDNYIKDVHPEPFDWDSWCRQTYHRAMDSFDGFSMAAAHTTNGLAKFYREGGIDVEIEFDRVLKYILADNTEDIVEELKHDIEYAFQWGPNAERVSQCKGTITWGKELISKTVKTAQLIKQLGECGIFSDEVRAEMYPDYLWARAQDVNNKLLSFAHNNFESDIDELSIYLENMQRIDEELKDGIKPIDPVRSELHNAYWISPEGHAYGLSGEIANMLHYQMAHAIVNQEDIREIDDDEGNDAYRTLEEAGWAKITNDNWVLFDGNHCKFTEEQRETIGTICMRINLEKKMAIRVGYCEQRFTGTRIKGMDLPQLQLMFTI